MYIDVNSFSHLADDSAVIQAAIDKARKECTGIVIPKLNRRTGETVWNISRSLVLPSGMTVVLEGAHLRHADGAFSHLFINEHFGNNPMAREHDRDITIRGEGGAVLDGGIHNGLYEVNGIARTTCAYPDHKPSENTMVRLSGIENLVIEGLTVRNARYWAINLRYCYFSRVSNIRFESQSGVPNQDGLDVGTGCHDMIVENLTGCTGDNMVAVCAFDTGFEKKVAEPSEDGDVRNIIIRNLLVYGVGGCSIVRILNHDGYKIYNIHIDTLIETSTWSDKDATVAPNPDLNLRTAEDGSIVKLRELTPGMEGYRCEAAIIIGESYWYSRRKAAPGETFGITVSNVMTHARYAVWINNTLQDSTFDNIRLFGNGFMAVYFGEGNVKNLRFSHISYDDDCRPLASDEYICIDWNKTESFGLSCVYFHGTELSGVVFDGISCGKGMNSVFGGSGKGNVFVRNIFSEDVPKLSTAEDVEVTVEG